MCATIDAEVTRLQRKLLTILKTHRGILQGQEILELRMRILEISPDSSLYPNFGGPMPRMDRNRRKEDVAIVPRLGLEVRLLREVYEHARAVLRFNGVDAHRCAEAAVRLEQAIEEVKQFDGGQHDELLALDARAHAQGVTQ